MAKINGNMLPLGQAVPDWNQSDSQAPDYIKNRPTEAITKAENALPRTGGTMTGAIEMSGKKITGLGTPENEGDAARKAYVDGKKQTATVTLAAEDWEDKAQTAQVTGVTAENTVIVSPTPESWEAWNSAGVRCTAQGEGSLSFRCEDIPGEITGNVLILN